MRTQAQGGSADARDRASSACARLPRARSLEARSKPARRTALACKVEVDGVGHKQRVGVVLVEDLARGCIAAVANYVVAAKDDQVRSKYTNKHTTKHTNK